MPVTVDDFIQEATGHTTASTSVVVTLAATTAGNTVLVFIYSPSSFVAASGVAAGFAQDSQASAACTAFHKSNVGAGETSWTFTLQISSSAAWYACEVENLSLSEPMDVYVQGTTSTVANGGTKSTLTTALNAGSSTVGIAVFGANKAGSGDVNSWSGYTNSFTEVVESVRGATTGGQITIARRFIEGWSTYETTATFATSAASESTASLLVLYRSVDASITAPLANLTGFEFGTHAGLGNGITGPLGNQTTITVPAGTFGTGYQVTSAAARNGSYGLRLTAAASIAYVYLPLMTVNTFSFGCNVRAVSGSGTPTAILFNASGASDPALIYDVANEKFGLQLGGGSVVWQTGTTPAGTWAWVDVRATMNSSIWHADWTIETGTGDGTQTSPTDLTGQVAATQLDIELGGPGSQTSVFDFDDVVVSRHFAAYPLKPHVVRILVPETTGATVSGTSTNFSKFTANGTLAAFASDAGALLDEVPPTVSASSDGLVQTAVAASDYVELPMTTYTLASDEIIGGVRFVAAQWGGTGSGTGTLGWRGYDGTTETVFQAASALYDADSLTAISATYPRWVSAMWSGGLNGAWTQTRLNAAAVRMGFSTDATPDMGASAVYLEVAVRDAPTVRTLTIEDPISASVDIVVNPYHSGTVSYVITNNDTVQTATFDYSVSGTPQTPVTVGPSSSTTVDVHADAFGDISDIALTAS